MEICNRQSVLLSLCLIILSDVFGPMVSLVRSSRGFYNFDDSVPADPWEWCSWSGRAAEVVAARLTVDLAEPASARRIQSDVRQSAVVKGIQELRIANTTVA